MIERCQLTSQTVPLAALLNLADCKWTGFDIARF